MNHWIDVYSSKTDEELLRIATSPDLLPEAKDALREVLASRKLGEAEIGEYADDLNWIDVQQIIRRPDLSKPDLVFHAQSWDASDCLSVLPVFHRLFG
jgi:hypothetical protein